jgi:hypothetical protein
MAGIMRQAMAAGPRLPPVRGVQTSHPERYRIP